eukprot:3036041-Pleurochrysis_carterae.AAC.2
MSCFRRWGAEGALVEKDAPSIFADFTLIMSLWVDTSTCSALPSMAKRDFAPLDMDRPPSVCGTPIGCSDVRSTCGSSGSKRAADQVEHGGDATTATQSVSDATSATRLATSSRARSCPMSPLS